MPNTVHITPPPLSSQAMADLLCTIVLLCRGTDARERPFWAYMCVKPSMAESFRKAWDQGDFCLGDYGTIIESGESANVPADTMLRMERDYGVRPDYESQLLAILQEERQRRNDA